MERDADEVGAGQPTRGIKPSTNEPWAIDLKYYQQKDNATLRT